MPNSNNKKIFTSHNSSLVVNIVNDEYDSKYYDPSYDLWLVDKHETHGVDCSQLKKITKDLTNNKRKMGEERPPRRNSKKAKETRTKQDWTPRVSNYSSPIHLSNNLDEKEEEEKIIVVINVVVSEEDQTEDKNLENISHTFTKNMRINLNRSKMCCSVGTGKPCPHGKKCRYAHSIEELNIAPCFFNRTCRRIEYREGIYHNCEQGPKCGFLHPGEEMINYCQRMNIKNKSQQRYDDPKPIVNKFTSPVKSCIQLQNKTSPVKPRIKRILNRKRPLCRSVLKKNICPHGKNCRFRHNV